MAGFEPEELQRHFGYLERCPPRFVEAVVVARGGSLKQRVAGLLAWREALLDGRLPPHTPWPDPTTAAPVREALEDMGLARFCRGEEALVDDLLDDLLQAFDRRARQLADEVAAKLRELEELERRRLEEKSEGDARARVKQLSGRALEELRRKAETAVRRRQTAPDHELVRAWSERARAWAAISEVFGDLGELLGRGWDLSLGVLRHTGWKDLMRLRALVEQLPQLKEIVRSLGRVRASEDNATSTSQRILTAVQRLEEERREVPTPWVPTETKGVERSGEIARMLPAEAAMLGHPKLRLLWHARRSERALLTYRVEGVEVEVDARAIEVLEERERRTPRHERGPILAVLDTSGSMHGTPELVAKALALEALRTAHAENRRCLLFTYSGPGQVLEQELALSPEGIGELLRFLAMSFGGGNDEAGVMTRVLQRVREDGWTKADVLFISDGEWPAPRKLEQLVEEVREHGTRLHGVQIGNRGRTGLHAVCDPVHVFQDWATLGGW